MRRRGRHAKSDTRSEELAIIVGFDAEWVDASHEDHDLPPDTSNRILSWQLFLFNPNTGQSCGIFVEPKSRHKASRSEPEAEGGCGTNDLRYDNQASLRPHPNRSGRGASLGADRRYDAAQPGPLWARRPGRGTWTAEDRVARRLLKRADGPLPRSRSRRLHRLCDDQRGDRCAVDGRMVNIVQEEMDVRAHVQLSGPSPCRCCATRSKRRA